MPERPPMTRDEPPGDAAPSAPDTLFGLSFESVSRAQQFLLAIQELGVDDKLQLADAVVVVKDHAGHIRVRETVDLQAGRTAFSGAMWTGLLGLIVGGPVGWIAGLGIGAGAGALTAKVIDLGIPDEWVDWFKDVVRPNTATVVVLASKIDQRALTAEVDRFPGARLVHTTIHADAFARLTAEVETDASTD